eukprot:CAMPEP_0167802156 /NCGR_PEP_ID=MMETSP0111_2-20121227/18938_1 /TAXON_ID=91324 /ORGANISM="Lotharella globosa, Strain CCCM811" /LENGTH=271 /DNA_ID=CAMNT_0007698111 /DNA_START=328 /DNA_END=1143 /DNA_ORIENTATION=-
MRSRHPAVTLYLAFFRNDSFFKNAPRFLDTGFALTTFPWLAWLVGLGAISFSTLAGVAFASSDVRSEDATFAICTEAFTIGAGGGMGLSTFFFFDGNAIIDTGNMTRLPSSRMLRTFFTKFLLFRLGVSGGRAGRLDSSLDESMSDSPRERTSSMNASSSVNIRSFWDADLAEARTGRLLACETSGGKGSGGCGDSGGGGGGSTEPISVEDEAAADESVLARRRRFRLVGWALSSPADLDDFFLEDDDDTLLPFRFFSFFSRLSLLIFLSC